MTNRPYPSLRIQLALFSFTRVIVNTGFRMVYPFLPVFARGLGVTPEDVALAVTARASVGIAAPLVGRIADLKGRRFGMVLGAGLFAAGLLLVVILPTYLGFVGGLLLVSAGKILFDPAVQAYLGDQVEYSRRGLAIAVTEFGWAGSFLIGMPLVGWLISREGWDAPFLWIAVLSLITAASLIGLVPSDTPQPEDRKGGAKLVWDFVRQPQVLAGLTTGLMLSAANEVVGIAYGVWMEGSFGLHVAALGAASTVIGLAEFGGEGLVAALADRYGKRRTVAIGTAASALAGLALPLLGHSVAGALLGLFFFYLAFEFTFVTNISLMTELLPSARATFMASYQASAFAGRALGALVGLPLFALGLSANAIVAAVTNALAIIITLRFIDVE